MSQFVLMGLFFFPLVVSVLTIKDVFENSLLDNSKKLMWIATIILLPLLGAIIYFFFGKSKQL
ncbi:PLDc N-terminal domain-containing protein [Pedobacter alpinus]|uniref:PLDc N-terminal domain-containing protein n=1 Tax=Pedobacter alpinus TaxID=1590643 RepID=A0ABW5TRH5_9SPHI